MNDVYTEAMQAIIAKRIESYEDTVGHTVKKSTKFSNSEGTKILVIEFTDGYWIMFEPVRYDNNDVTFHIIDDDHFRNYFYYVLFKVGICTEEVYQAESDAYMKVYYERVNNARKENILEWLPKYPDLFDTVKGIINS